MTVSLVTGYTGTEHVTSGQDGARQAGTVGTGMYVLMTNDNPLAATLENANTVTVGPGDVLINGRHVQLTGATTFSIPVGTQAQQTSNLLVIRYSRDDSGVETAESLTLTGSPSASDPQDPELATGNILDGDTPVDMPLYRVITTGIETADPVKLFSTIAPMSTLPGADGGALPVSLGGTGATTAGGAADNLLFVRRNSNDDDAYAYSVPDSNNFVALRIDRGDNKNALLAMADNLRLHDFNSGSVRWSLYPDAVSKGVFKSTRATITDASRDSLFNLPPGSYCMSNDATNSPCPGSYGNLTISYAAGNRVSVLAAFDNGEIWTIYGAQGASSGKVDNWRRLKTLKGSFDLLFNGTVGNGGSVTVDTSEYNFFGIKTSYAANILIPAIKFPSGNIIGFGGFYFSGTGNTNGALAGATLIYGSGNTYTAYCRGQDFAGSWWNNAVDKTNLLSIYGIG